MNGFLHEVSGGFFKSLCDMMYPAFLLVVLSSLFPPTSEKELFFQFLSSKLNFLNDFCILIFSKYNILEFFYFAEIIHSVSHFLLSADDSKQSTDHSTHPSSNSFDRNSLTYSFIENPSDLSPAWIQLDLRLFYVIEKVAVVNSHDESLSLSIMEVLLILCTSILKVF